MSKFPSQTQNQGVYDTNRAAYTIVNQRQHPVQDSVQIVDPYTPQYPRTSSATDYNSNVFRFLASTPSLFRGTISDGSQHAQNQEIESFDEPETSTDISEREATSLLARYFGILLSLFSNVLLSGSLTSAICAFTPLCTISFLLSFLRLNQGDMQQSTDEYINSNDIEMLRKTFEKYTQMQAKIRASESIKSKLKSKSKAVKSVEEVTTHTGTNASNRRA